MLTELLHGGVRGGPAAVERVERTGGPRLGEVDEGLAAFLLENTDGVLDGEADFLDDVRHPEEIARLTARQYRGERPDTGQCHQGHEQQRHDLPADRFPAKAHGLPQLDPRQARGHTCASTNGVSLLPTHTYLEGPVGRTAHPRRTRHGQLSVHWGRLPPPVGYLNPWHPVGEVGRLAGFFVPWESSAHVDRLSVRELGAEWATGPACRSQAA